MELDSLKPLFTALLSKLNGCIDVNHPQCPVIHRSFVEAFNVRLPEHVGISIIIIHQTSLLINGRLVSHSGTVETNAISDLISSKLPELQNDDYQLDSIIIERLPYSAQLYVSILYTDENFCECEYKLTFWLGFRTLQFKWETLLDVNLYKSLLTDEQVKTQMEQIDLKMFQLSI